ncbi:hypothetical protein [Desulfofustis limnaeus]|jgi:hypothetical protein|uniref:Uncharacterized protein n=1 Tax=Desulfofustis limnaeus TaxID=2740163 RepID=A0ABN6M818_9BACT|nr:hypothetical protein [Desulfofustis limnaeus]MDX9896808.1 hypothetical protein [Desulfofustis sp.]BDD87921.1 hypothetical protein DPPLL_22860 [Desulfofustis limnaeus]
MTNTLHRFGTPDTLNNDFIVFAMAAKGFNEQGALDKAKAFLRAAIKYQPINMGNALVNSLYRPEKDLTFIKLYFVGRQQKTTYEKLIDEIPGPGSAAVVFDDPNKVKNFVRDVKQLDLGLSINISALVDDVRNICGEVEITPHAVEYTLGFHGDTSRLPERDTLSLTTMCGHGMVSANFAKKMIDRVKEGRMDPQEAACCMAKFCVCGVFNTTRAMRVLNRVKKGQ